MRANRMSEKMTHIRTMTITCWKVSISQYIALTFRRVCLLLLFLSSRYFSTGWARIWIQLLLSSCSSLSVFFRAALYWFCLFFLFFGSTMLPRLTRFFTATALLLFSSSVCVSLALFLSSNLFASVALIHNVSIRCSSRCYKYTVFKCPCVRTSQPLPRCSTVQIKTPKKTRNSKHDIFIPSKWESARALLRYARLLLILIFFPSVICLYL